MHRFYCLQLPPLRSPEGDLWDGPPALASLDAQEAHHARRVLRLELGQEVEVFDGRGLVGRGRLESWAQGAQVRLTALRQVPRSVPTLELAVAIPKGPRADDMVNQLSQLGVDRLIPLRTSRSVVDPRPQKLEKFARAAIESAKQSGRAYLMLVEPQATLAQVLAGNSSQELRLIAAPGASSPAALGERLRGAQRLLILIGPEGGWTAEELELARIAGCQPWALGPHILRIETAALAAAAVARYLLAP